MKVDIKVVSNEDIKDDSLIHFKRYQHTTKMLVNNEGVIEEKDTDFIDDWDHNRLKEITEELREDNTITLFVYHEDKVIGFGNIINELFDGYVNVDFVHISEDYRGMRLGRKLMYAIAREAVKIGADKIYLSTHPSIESQSFYQSVGCVLAEKVNEELLALEPYDLQLELDLQAFKLEIMMQEEFDELGRVTAKTIGKVASKLYKHVPKDYRFNHVIEYLISIERYGFFSVATTWAKRNTDILKMENLPFYEKVLYKHIYGWARVDQFCYRIMNPLIELSDSNYEYLLKWSDSTNKDIRRTALVSMIRSSGKLTLEYDYDKMIYLVHKLKDDEDIHVKKAVGWVLKCAFVTYPVKVEKYLRKNVGNLDRLIFRYALEHVKDPLRKELMSL